MIIFREFVDYCLREGIEVFLCRNLEECVEKVNEIVFEYFEIIIENFEEFVDFIENVGVIYFGFYIFVLVVDYFFGVNYVFLIGGVVRFSGVLMVMDFMKFIIFVRVSREEFLVYRRFGMRLVEIEGMEVYRRSLEVRR